MRFARRTVGEVALLAGLLVVVVAGSLAAQQRQVPPAAPIDAGSVVLLVGAVAVLAGRRRWPRSVLAAVAVIIGIYLGLGYPYGPILLAASVAVFALAGVDTAAVGVVAVIGAVGLWLGAVAPTLLPADGWSSLAGAGAGFAAWLIIPAWWAMVRGRRRDALAAATERRRHEFDEQRLGLAREVHDVVAHNLTVIGVQTGAALRVFDRDPDRAREALETVARTNRQALAELRDTIDLLRNPDHADEVDRRPPAGGLADLPVLVESARSAGASVTLHAAAPATAATTPVVERTAYRIVQESVTNALRHAPGATVTVAVGHDADALLVRIDDDGPGAGGHPEGRGILGMRERAAAIGGVLTVTSDEAGGVTVCARLPMGRDTR